AGFNTSVGANEPANGVARESRIVSVQVFTRFDGLFECLLAGSLPPCIGAYSSDVLSGLNWVITDALNLPGGVRLASVNMSLGGGEEPGACDTDSRKIPIDLLKSNGVATVVAAGNDG